MNLRPSTSYRASSSTENLVYFGCDSPVPVLRGELGSIMTGGFTSLLTSLARSSSWRAVGRPSGSILEVDRSLLQPIPSTKVAVSD